MTWLRKGLDILALVYAILYFPVPIFWLFIHPAVHFWRRFGNRSFWIALPLWGISGTALVLLRHDLFAWRIGQNTASWILGVVLVVLASWIERRAVKGLGLRRLAGLPEMNRARDSGGVVSTGIYAYIRHPRYFSLILGFVGFTFLTGAVGIFSLAIVTVLLYQIVAPLEERELREHYGSQYEVYARAVPRFIPRPWRKTQPQISS